MSYVWTDDPLYDGTEPNPTKIRAVHVAELRTNINQELVKRSIPLRTWDGSITHDVTKVRKVHVDELRTAIEDANSVTPIYCRSNTPFDINWTDPTIEYDVTKIRKVHIEELRQYTDSLSNNCYCDCNGPCNCNCNAPCSYCAHCGQGCCHSMGSR